MSTRTRKGIVVDKKLWEQFSSLSAKTRIPKSRLLDEAIEDLLRKHGFLKKTDSGEN